MRIVLNCQDESYVKAAPRYSGVRTDSYPSVPFRAIRRKEATRREWYCDDAEMGCNGGAAFSFAWLLMTATILGMHR